MYSQNTNITQEQKNRIEKIFTPDNIIEFSKGLSNEQRQRQYITDLEYTVRQKDSLIQVLLQRDSTYLSKEREFLEKYNTVNNNLLSKNTRLQEVLSKNDELQREKSRGSFLLVTDCNPIMYDNYSHVFFGVSYYRSDLLLGVKVNPINNVFRYSFEVGFKIF